MIQFVNAKLNLGLHITHRRPDGYHDLETVFYPVGKFNGTPDNPEAFCDILEITPASETGFIWSGRKIECADADNLVCRAVRAYEAVFPDSVAVEVRLEKHLPDGAGLGGGSADASFALRMINELNDHPLTDSELEKIALSLGADCPVFIKNDPAYAEGVGERLTPICKVLADKWCVIVRPPVYVSTREAFAGVVPRAGRVDLREAVMRPLNEWKGLIVNDFEDSIFPSHPELAEVKERLYELGAVYASMSGSGSSLFGIFDTADDARKVAGAPGWNGMSVYVCRL